MDERKVAVVGAAAQLLARRKLADVDHQFIEQHNAWGESREQFREELFARRGAVFIGLLHHGVSIRLAELPGHLAPESPDRLFAILPWLAGGVCCAIEHSHFGVGHIKQPRTIQQSWNPCQLSQCTFARGQMIHRQHRVCLAATEGRLQLDDRFATLAVEALGHLCEQAPHAFGYEGSLVECLRISVFLRCPARAHRREVGGKFRLLECAAEHIRMRDDDFSPGFQIHNF